MHICPCMLNGLENDIVYIVISLISCLVNGVTYLDMFEWYNNASVAHRGVQVSCTMGHMNQNQGSLETII